jgi:hypothetical protein
VARADNPVIADRSLRREDWQLAVRAAPPVTAGCSATPGTINDNIRDQIMPESQRESERIRQVSPPVYNAETGYWHNKVRIIEPSGSGGYRVAGEEVHQNKDKKLLPVPWEQNVEAYLLSKLPPIGFGMLSGRRRPNQAPGALGEKLDRHRGTGVAVKGFIDTWHEINEGYRNGDNPLSGTPFDVPYHSWPGTDKPWDWSTVHPYGRDPSPRPNPDGFAPHYSDPERGSEVGDVRTFATAEPNEPPAAPAGAGPPALTGATLPPQVLATGHYLRANGYEITPRTMYVAHVLGPERAVDLFRRTGSTGGPPEVPSPDMATGDQMRAWVRALRAPGVVPPIGGIAAPAPAAPEVANAGPGAPPDLNNLMQ